MSSQAPEGEEQGQSQSRDDLLIINRLCDQFEQSLRHWRDMSETGESPTAESVLDQVADRLRTQALHELIPIEMEYRSSCGQTLLLQEYRRRFPEVESGWLVDLLQESVSDSPANPTRSISTGSSDTDASSPFELEDSPPKQIGHYEIIGELGSGGMGTVYQAVHREMQRDVALKMMRPDLCRQEALRKRFRREVQAAARLVHPNIVTAYDAGEHDGRPFLVSELIDGIDLNRVVKRDGPVETETAICYVTDAAKGLAYAHQHDIVHRDIKPANLLLDHQGVVKVLDMGLARLSVESDSTEQRDEVTEDLTRSGAVMGTATYMAPEQARSTRHADQRSDIYSLGCVLYFLMEGRPPFRGESMVDTLLAHATEPVPELSMVSEPGPHWKAVQDVMHRMMAKSPEDRPQSMQEVVDTLSGLSGDLASIPSVSIQIDTGMKHSSVSAKRSQQKRKPNTALIVGAALGVLGTLAWFGFLFLDSEPKVSLEASSASPGNLAGRNSATGNVANVNRAVLFSGEDSYIEVPSITKSPGDAVTIEIIARLDGQRTSNAVCWLGENWMALYHTGFWGIARKQGSESLFAVSRDNDQDLQGRWRHIAGTWDGQQLAVFVDGIAVPSNSINFELGDTEPGMFIGGADPNRLPVGQNIRFFVGAIDAVRITERVLYPKGKSFAPPTQLTPVPDTLALYQFDEEPGRKIYRDSSGNGHHGHAHRVANITVE